MIDMTTILYNFHIKYSFLKYMILGFILFYNILISTLSAVSLYYTDEKYKTSYKFLEMIIIYSLIVNLMAICCLIAVFNMDEKYKYILSNANYKINKYVFAIILFLYICLQLANMIYSTIYIINAEDIPHNKYIKLFINYYSYISLGMFILYSVFTNALIVIVCKC